MSEPCEHQRDEAAWIWAQQLRFVADERDAAQARLKRVKEVCAIADDINGAYTGVLTTSMIRDAIDGEP